jgi:adenylate kinase family enzyme
MTSSGKSTLARVMVERPRGDRHVYHLDRLAAHAENVALGTRMGKSIEGDSTREDRQDA